MFTPLVARVLTHHPEFTHEEVREYCELFLDSLPRKVQGEARLKQLTKYIEKEF